MTEEWMVSGMLSGEMGPYEEAEPFNAIRDLKTELQNTKKRVANLEYALKQSEAELELVKMEAEDCVKQEAEIKRLRMELETEHDALHDALDGEKALYDEKQVLKAEAERLREVLDAIRRDDFDRAIHPSAAALAGYALNWDRRELLREAALTSEQALEILRVLGVLQWAVEHEDIIARLKMIHEIRRGR